MAHNQGGGLARRHGGEDRGLDLLIPNPNKAPGNQLPGNLDLASYNTLKEKLHPRVLDSVFSMLRAKLPQ